jgi:hypothetical protein
MTVVKGRFAIVGVVEGEVLVGVFVAGFVLVDVLS